MTSETALTISEQSQLSELEDIIDRGLQTFYEVGKALTVIRDEKLYRAGYATFEDYCEEKWQMSRAYAYRTIGAADVVKGLSPIGDIPLPTNEAQARPLTRLEPEQRQQAWSKAVEESGGKPTARQVQAAADEVTGKASKWSFVAPFNRTIIPPDVPDASESAYESIHSLQSAVLAFHKRVCANNKDMIASLEMLKNDHKSAGWGALSLDLGRNGKIFRNNDLRQAVNNALDSMRFTAGQTTISESSEPAQVTPDDLAIQSAGEVAALLIVHESSPVYKVPAETLAHFGEKISASNLTNNRALGIVEYGNSQWVCTGGTSRGHSWMYVNAIRAMPPDTFHGTVVDYDIICKRGIRGEWFYHGQLIRCRGSEYVLVGPEATFELQEQPATEPVAAAPVLNEEQKPRIASFVMGYFQAANEAIARIATAIPKARTDDIHDMLTILASLERMEQRIGAEYDMS